MSTTRIAHRITLGPATFVEVTADNGSWSGWANIAPIFVGEHKTEDDARNALVVALSTMLHRLTSDADHGPIAVVPLSTLTALGVDPTGLVGVDVPPAAATVPPSVAPSLEVAHHTAGQPTDTTHNAGPIVVDTGAPPSPVRPAPLDGGPVIEGNGIPGH